MESTKYKILLIEDDRIDQKAFEWLITEEDLPYDCTIAKSLSEAHEILNHQKFDAIITDYLLPDGTAFDILDLVKDAPVIITTGAGDEEIAVKAIKAGASDYLIKDHDRTYLKAIPTIVQNAIKHKKLEEIIDQKQKNLLAIFDAVPVGMLLIDENMKVVRVNDAVRQVVRKDYSQIINRPVGNALCCTNSTYSDKGCGFSPFCPACILRTNCLGALNSGQSIKKVEMQLTLKVGDKEVSPWLSISAEPIVIDGHKHAVIAIDDITDRKIAEEKLKETMELKSQFISTVSHELRTPLGCMKEAIAIVFDGLAGQINEKQSNFLDIARRNVDRLSTLINNVLDFQKLDAGKMRLDVQENDIAKVVEEVYQTMACLAKKREIALSLEFADKLPKARFDSPKIIQVLTNLVSNALKFTPDGGRVSIGVSRQGEELVLRVSDTGMGIPKESLPKIFEQFYRVHRPGVEIQGTGLGLSIVRKIVVLHGGRIEIESEVNKGTSFVVFLPLAGVQQEKMLPEKVDQTLEKTLAEK